MKFWQVILVACVGYIGGTVLKNSEWGNKADKWVDTKLEELKEWSEKQLPKED